MTTKIPKHIQYELAGEWPSENRKEWLVTLYHYKGGVLVASVTTTAAGWFEAVNRAMCTMGKVVEELETTGQLLMDQGDTYIRYGDAVIRA